MEFQEVNSLIPSQLPGIANFTVRRHPPRIKKMATLKSPLRQLCSLIFFFVAFASALKFDLAARGQHENKPWRCIRNFVGRDTLVVVTATVSGYRGDGMVVNMHVGVPTMPQVMALVLTPR